MQENRVALDTDFINKITEYESRDPAALFRDIFDALGKTPVVHPFIAEHELMHNKVALDLIEQGVIQTIPYEEFLPSEDAEARTFYTTMFRELNTKITGCSLSEQTNIFNSNAGHSFGEVHTVLMAVELGIPLFYSNDGGAKAAAVAYAEGRLIVQNIEEVVEQLQDSDKISGKEKRYLRKKRGRQ